MTARAMSADEIAATCETLSYHPHSNVTGLINGYGDGAARILFDNWTNSDKSKPGGSVHVHSLIPEPRYLTKGFIREFFRYPFEIVDYVIGVTPGFNEKALAFNKRLGFTPMIRLADGYAKGVDLVWQSMHYTTCRYWQRPAPTESTFRRSP